jgi:hypothetical protein
MKKVFKLAVTMMLMAAMVFSIMPVTKAEAAKTTNVTLYVGEAIYVTNYNKVKSVKSSKKSVVKAVKDKSRDYKANLFAKKTGTANITIKTVRGTMNYKITVKKAKFDFGYEVIPNYGVVFTAVNKTKQIFDTIKIHYTIKDINGATLVSDDARISALIPGKTSYSNSVYLNRDQFENFDPSSITVTLEEYDRMPGYTYKDASSSLKITSKDANVVSENEVDVDLRYENSSKKRLSGYVTVLFYNANGELKDISNRSIYLNSKGADSTKVMSSNWKSYDAVAGAYVNDTFGRIEIVKNVYTYAR